MLYPNGTPTKPHVSSPFGPRTGGAFSFHYGADLVGFTTIRAVAAGLVTFAGFLNSSAGNTIVIDHGAGVTSVYMHNRSHHVRRGDRVTEGQSIATMGDSGNATGPCNHLEIRIHGASVEPLGYIAARLTAPTPQQKQEEEMTTSFINVQGKAGSHRAGTFAIMRSNAGALFAKRVTFDSFMPDTPIIDNSLLDAWQESMKFYELK